MLRVDQLEIHLSGWSSRDHRARCALRGRMSHAVLDDSARKQTCRADLCLNPATLASIMLLAVRPTTNQWVSNQTYGCVQTHLADRIDIITAGSSKTRLQSQEHPENPHRTRHPRIDSHDAIDQGWHLLRCALQASIIRKLDFKHLLLHACKHAVQQWPRIHIMQSIACSNFALCMSSLLRAAATYAAERARQYEYEGSLFARSWRGVTEFCTTAAHCKPQNQKPPQLQATDAPRLFNTMRTQRSNYNIKPSKTGTTGAIWAPNVTTL